MKERILLRMEFPIEAKFLSAICAAVPHGVIIGYRKSHYPDAEELLFIVEEKSEEVAE